MQNCPFVSGLKNKEGSRERISATLGQLAWPVEVVGYLEGYGEMRQDLADVYRFSGGNLSISLAAMGASAGAKSKPFSSDAATHRYSSCSTGKIASPSQWQK